MREVALPLGMPVELDAATVVHPNGSLVGGSPGRILRLNGRARTAFEELRAGTVSSADAARLGRKLTDVGALHPVPAPLHTADVTVVIPVHGRATELDVCLRWLGPGYPVIVVDDGSDEPDAAGLREVAGRHGARLLRRELNGGPGAARNTGLGQVGTEFVAFLDSDCLPPPTWIPALMGHSRIRWWPPWRRGSSLRGRRRRRSPRGSRPPGRCSISVTDRPGSSR